MNKNILRGEKAYSIAKRALYATLTVAALAFYTSCDNFLDISPKESIASDQAIVDVTSLNTAIRGAYRSLGNGSYYGEGYVNLGFVPGGEVIYNVFDNISDLNFRADDGAFVGAWSAIYRSIDLANHIIEKAPKVNDVNLSEPVRKQIIGEAHFIRALAYFDLARGWGGVPIKTTPTKDVSDGTGGERSSVAQVYALVLEDLNKAEAALPAEVNRIRATKHTVWALKARYFLYNRQWAEAVDYATRVINLSGGYQLQQPFSAWFANSTQTPESIFEIAFSAVNTSGLRARMSLLSRGGEYRYRPGGPIIATLRNRETGGARIALLDSAKQSGVTQYAGALYFRRPATDPSYVLRLAELYLIRAEANAQLDGLGTAVADLNVIRTRAGLAASTASTKEALLDAILEERRLEFLWEAHRYFDLVRTGKLKEKIKQLKPNLSIEARQNLFPIPVNEVIIGKLPQNPGY